MPNTGFSVSRNSLVRKKEGFLGYFLLGGGVVGLPDGWYHKHLESDRYLNTM